MAELGKIAFVIDALSGPHGAERILEAMLELYPQAPIYTLVFQPKAFAGTPIADRVVRTSWIQRMPGGRQHYRACLPLLPLTIELFDLRAFDIVISLSYAVAHGVLCRPEQLHISYTSSPLRHAWQSAQDFLPKHPLLPLSRLLMHYFRLWDRAAALGVDHLVAISRWTSLGIWRAYHRRSEVIYPPVDTVKFRPLGQRGRDFVVVSRLVGWKKVDLICQAFSELGLPLVVVGEGPERRKLESGAPANIRFVGQQSTEAVANLLGGARALVHAAEEDFGLVMGEAQAAGCPVIAYRSGAAPEIVVDGRTGLLFSEQTTESLAATIQQFQRDGESFPEAECIANAQRFDRGRFMRAFGEMVDRELRARGDGFKDD